MALVSSAPPCSETQLARKSVTVRKKQLMLKDYLMDDLSSCSSNGFKSFPRRQCCTTVRFLLDVDIKSSTTARLPPPPSLPNHNKKLNHNQNQNQLLRRSRSSAAAANTISALQRASGVVINAFKNLPFHSVKLSTSVQSKSRKGGGLVLLPGSLSLRLWGKNYSSRPTKAVKEVEEVKDIGRWRSFRELLLEDRPSDQNTASTRSTDSKSSNSWTESEFTVRSESLVGNDVLAIEEGKNSSPVSGKVGATTATPTCSPPQTTKVWLHKEEEKEQFSPVSVLDCPFEEDQEDESRSSGSHLRRRLSRMEGSQNKFVQKIGRFENIALVEPLDLEERITMSEADELVNQLIIKTSYNNSVMRTKADKLVVDLFGERSGAINNGDENAVVVDEVLNVAEKWMTGKSQEKLLSWEFEEGRKVYVNDMDNKYCGRWVILEEQEKEVGLELEVEVWNSLFDDLLLDLIS